MIKRLEHSKPEVAKQIREVFQVSYAVEAELLKATYFPPLHRELADYIDTETLFYGYFEGTALVAVVEVRESKEYTHIQSLVVHPEHFRKGIGKKLCSHVMNKHTSEVFMVETGVANAPACQLYLALGFEKVSEWDTEYGIRKIRFLKKI